ncbi:MAG: carbohydrate kinase [Verrucomicrobiae bacterium]|nr:carbohydrate kinase [Verrucomicrobiae bacterium]NNJ43335.1 carbohydrate kinase [Akkermansiaceae bacterium]
MFLGLDCSTQSFSALIIDARKGTIAHEASVSFENDLPHYQTSSGFVHGDQPGEVFSDPLMWVEALDLLLSRLVENGADLASITAVAGSGQQHATVYLNEKFATTLAHLDSTNCLKDQLAPCLTRPLSPIWMDSSTGDECEEIATAIGGNDELCRRTGSIAIKRFSGAQIRRFSKIAPDAWQNTATVHLNSSFFASILAGNSVSIDHGDGAGMNLLNLSSGDWDADVLQATAPHLADKLPPVAPSSTIVGNIAPYFVEKYQFNPEAKAVLWSGDNPCSLVGMGAASPGKMVISLGTSYTLFAAMDQPLTDPQGFGHVFGNPCGKFMSLICFQNGTLAYQKVKEAQSLSWQDFDVQALTPPTAGDTPTLPFLEPEITPLATASSQENTSIRSLLDGQFLSMRQHSDWMGTPADTIYVTGGGSQSKGICQTIANVFNASVQGLETNSSAGLGAAMRAAHATGEFTLESLETNFCQPTAGSRVTPDPEAVTTYQSLATTFQSLLNQHLSTN